MRSRSKAPLGERTGFQVHAWERDSRNPILPPSPDKRGDTFDVRCCMNPFVLPRGQEYWMFYAGADRDGRVRICLATASIDELAAWKRHGPLFDLGGRGAFDESWCVLPCLHRIGGRWHLYYTGRSADADAGLQGFGGIGLAVSDDLTTWTKHSDEPVLTGEGFSEWPDNRGVAGGGRILEVTGPESSVSYRMYYTLATGRPSPRLREDQAKQSVVAHSDDGISWNDRRVVLRPRPDVDHENVAVIGLNVWKAENRYRAIYAAIGSRFGAYSICEAVGQDGLTWDRGTGSDNLALAPTGVGWESEMTTYPNVVDEGDSLRLFYCGNRYGSTGIGTAVADPLK